MKKKLKVKIVKTAPTGGEWDDHASIEITDSNSHLTVGEIKISFEEFGKMMAGNMYIKGEITIYDNFETFGKIKEHIHIKEADHLDIFLKYGSKISYSTKEEEKREIIEQIRQELIACNHFDSSWKYSSDNFNRSYARREKTSIIFYRYTEQNNEKL